MSTASFWRRFGALEHEQLEFKRSANHVGDVIVAMAMTRGGTILLGVTDERRLAGWPLDQHTLDRIATVAYETGAEVAATELVVAGVPLTMVTVAAAEDRIVTTPDGRLLRRLGSHNQPLRGDALLRFVRARDAALAARA